VILHAVKVLGDNGSGTTEEVIAGIDWAAAHSKGKTACANMSLGGSYSAALNNAVTAAVNGGLTFVVAAGNDAADACNYSPASTPAAISVGSTDISDFRSSFSNCGRCVDIMAPGSNVYSAWFGNNGAVKTISGTSMACPHVCGIVALYLAENPSATPAQVAAHIVNSGTPLFLAGNFGTCPKLLAYIDCEESITC